MNVKFFLTISLCIGCLFMLFLWHSANNIYKESQIYEKQYSFKISSLQSENKMELKLIDALRVDIAKNEKELNMKTDLLESLHTKEKHLEEEKEKLKLNIENIKKDYEIVNKENNQWLDLWKVQSQNKSDIEKSNIQKLESDLEALHVEYGNVNLAITQSLPIDSNVKSMNKNKDLKKDNNNEEKKRKQIARFKNITDKKLIKEELTNPINNTFIDDMKKLKGLKNNTFTSHTKGVKKELIIPKSIILINEKKKQLKDVKNITSSTYKKRPFQKLIITENRIPNKQNIKNKLEISEDKHKQRLQAKPPILKKTIEDYQSVNEQINKYDNEKGNLPKDQNKIDIQKPDEMIQPVQNDNHLQAKPPMIKDKFVIMDNNHYVVHPSTQLKKDDAKLTDDDKFPDQSKSKNIDDDQLIKSKVIASKDIKDEEKGDNLELEDRLRKIKDDSLKSNNIKLIRKDSNHQVKPPVPRKIWDSMKKNIKAKDSESDQINLNQLDKPINDAVDYVNEEKKENKGKFKEANNVKNRLME